MQWIESGNQTRAPIEACPDCLLDSLLTAPADFAEQAN